MQTYHNEMIEDDAPLDVWAENALLGQHDWLARYDLGHVSSPSRASAILSRTRPSTDTWREEIACAVESIIYVIPVKLTAELRRINLRLAGHTRSQLANPKDLTWSMYLARSPEQVVSDLMEYDASQPTSVLLTLDHPRPGETYEDLLVVTMVSGLAAAGANAWQFITDMTSPTDGRLDGTGVSDLTGAALSPDTAVYIEGHGWYDIDGTDASGLRGPYAYGLAPYTFPAIAAFVPITAYTPRAVDLYLEGYEDPASIPQAALLPNIPVEGRVHARHEQLVRRARDHRRPLACELMTDRLTGAETTQGVRWRRAEYSNSYRDLVRESIWLDRGDYGTLTARLVILSCTGGLIKDTDAVRDEPDFAARQAWRVRLLQYEDGTGTIGEIYEGEAELELAGYDPRNYTTNHRALVGARRWGRLHVTAQWHRRLEEYATNDRGTALRWGQLSEADLEVCNVCEINIPLAGLTFDASRPLVLVVDIEDDVSQPAYDESQGDNPVVGSSRWSFPRFAAHIVVGGMIFWEAP